MKEILNPTTVTKKCIFCNKEVSIVVDELDLAKREAGEYVQSCFPYLSAGEGEMFISGVCPECFDMTFKDEDEIVEIPGKVKVNSEDIETLYNETEGLHPVRNNKKGALLEYDVYTFYKIQRSLARFLDKYTDYEIYTPDEMMMLFLKSDEFKALNIEVTHNFCYCLGFQFDNILFGAMNDCKRGIAFEPDMTEEEVLATVITMSQMQDTLSKLADKEK